ncbi:MAG TPA: hypothetical protein VE871_11900 [Longimicrobium sp.]|nr:hypothetical protein [Longimicrobium sp.]
MCRGDPAVDECRRGSRCSRVLVSAGSLFNPFRRTMMSTTGEKPGKGTYACKSCGQKVVLDDASDTLPPCPSCSKTKFRP